MNLGRRGRLHWAVLGSVVVLGLNVPAATGGHGGTNCQTFHDQMGDSEWYDGSPGCDIVWLYDREDKAYGHGSADDLHMGDGDDNAQAGNGNDWVYGGANGNGFDWLYGEGDNDFVMDRDASDGEDTLCGKGGDDYLETGDGDNADQLYGGDGFDTTDDGSDSDVVSGGDHGIDCVDQ